MTKQDIIAKLQALLEQIIKRTVSRTIRWQNVKDSMLGECTFTSTTPFQKYVKYNTSVGKHVNYEKSYYCELTSGDSTNYLLLTYMLNECAEETLEFYALTSGNTKLVEFSYPEIQPLLRRLNNAIIYGPESEEEINALGKIILPEGT